MKLLDLKTVKKERAKGVVEKIDTVERLNKAESDAVKSLNQTLSFVEDEKKRLDKDIKDYGVRIEARKKILVNEVKGLETRRKAALRPILEEKGDADRRIVLAEQKEGDIAKREVVLKAKEELLVERLEVLKDTKEELSDRERIVSDREDKVVRQEAEVKKSTEALNKAWTEFYQKVGVANDDILKREKEVNDKEKANQSYAETLDQRKIELDNYKIKLLDERRTLDRAWGELKRKEQKHGRS